MATGQKLELGDEVRDRVTGLQGIATSITTRLHGCAHVGIQPPVGKDGKLEEGRAIDEPQCEIITKGKVAPAEFAAEKINVALGDEVIDPVTKFTGVIDSKTLFINGCTRFGVQPPVDKKGRMRDSHFFDGPRLEVVAAKKAKVAPEEKRPGGPMSALPPSY